jgi:nickel superoxide dismutase
MNMRPLRLSAFSALALMAVAGSTAYAHCQVPCGIYNDPVRFTLLDECITTIEKAMTQIETLSAEPHPNWNQIVRWVDNKDKQADDFSEIVTYYFMAQRVKPADPADPAAYAKYVKQITLLHQMVVYAMKTKQTTDLENCKKLRSLLHEFQASYLGEQAQAKPAEHSHGGQAPHSH